MSENESDYGYIDRRIKPGLKIRIGGYSLLELESESDLIVATDVLARAGVISGPEGDEFDLDLAVETVREHAIDPSLN